MNILERASGVLKDQNSIWLASLSRRTALRNPDIESAVIKCTSHDESHVDYRNAQRVFAWVRVSPAYLKPLVWAISKRMNKTRSWVVALKGLMLMHGVFCCKVPAIQRIGRLPFDLSSFSDGHSKRGELWGHNEFIRAYFTFLDRKSFFIFHYAQEKRKGELHRIVGNEEEENSIMKKDLVWLQKMQGLLDTLMQVKPKGNYMIAKLILEAMDCVVIEIFDVYSRICSAISMFLTSIYSIGKVEALMGLKILQKARAQGEELCSYFEFCRDIGVVNAADCPKLEEISEEDIRELEHIINGVPEKFDHKNEAVEEDKALVAVSSETRSITAHEQLRTVITNNWEVFDEEQPKGTVVKAKAEEPFLPLITLIDPGDMHSNNKELPDLITF